MQQINDVPLLSMDLQSSVERLWEAATNCTSWELDVVLQRCAIETRVALAQALGDPNDIAYWVGRLKEIYEAET